MKSIEYLMMEYQRLSGLKNELSHKTRLETSEGMVYARLLVKLVMLQMEIEDLKQKR